GRWRRCCWERSTRPRWSSPAPRIRSPLAPRWARRSRISWPACAARPSRSGRVLLRTDSRGVLAIGQPSHAWISGQLARIWGNARFGAVEPYEEVCLGAEQHDVGMADWDLAPAR